MKKLFTIVSLLTLVFVGRPLIAAPDSSAIRITKAQANDAAHPIEVLLNNDIEISLKGIESNSSVYCSGAGCQHGYRWEYDNSSDEDGVLTVTSVPINAILARFSGENEFHNGWNTKQTSYRWSFIPKKAGLTTLTFKKYYYSNAMVRNTDGSLLWKDPVETIQFTINVTDYSAIPDDAKIIPWQGGATVNQ